MRCSTRGSGPPFREEFRRKRYIKINTLLRQAIKEIDAAPDNIAPTSGGINLDPKAMRLEENTAPLPKNAPEVSASADMLANVTGLIPIVGTISLINDLRVLLSQ